MDSAGLHQTKNLNGRRYLQPKHGYVTVKRPIQLKTSLLISSFLCILACFLPLAWCQTLLGLEKVGPPKVQEQQANMVIVKGIDLLYDEEFDKAEHLFQKVITNSPKKPEGYFYLAMVTWSRLAAGFWSRDTVREYKERIEWTIQVAKNRIKNNVANSNDYLYLGGALGFMGRFELMKGKWLSSYFLARDAINALNMCYEMDPNNKDVLLGLGTFDYYTARLSGFLKFLTYLFVHQGNKEEGLRKISVSAREAVYSSTEAKSMLIHIYLFMEEEYQKAFILTDELAKKYERSPRYKFLQGVCYLRLGMVKQYKKCVLYLREKSLLAPSVREAGMWAKRAVYLETVHDFLNGNYCAARSKLEIILKGADPENDPAMIAWPLIKIGVSYDLEGNREMATKYYRQIINMENGAGAQFLAKKYLDSPPKKDDPFVGF
jgi:tetratricopeptide (TPR) repeat protein